MKKKWVKVVTSVLLAATMITTNVMQPLQVFAGTVVGQSTFDDGVGLPWHTCQTNPASQSFEISGGTYNVTLENIGGEANGGESRWDLQLRHRGLKIEQGHTYTVTFDVNSTNEGRLYTKIGDLSGDLELWHNCMGLTNTTTSGEHNKQGADKNQSWDPLDVKKGDNHFECTFTADQTLTVAEWAFHYGGRGQWQPNFDCFPVGTTLKFDNLSLECTTCGNTSGDGCNWDSSNEMGYVTPRSDVRVNQVGYYTNLSKVASYATDKEIAPVTFAVKNSSGKTVFEGTGVNKGYDEASGEYVQLLDFTDLDQAGTDYYIEVSDKDNVQTNRYTKETYQMWKSHSFDVVDPSQGNVYDGVLTNALNYYYQNRSGEEIKSQYITSGDKDKLAHQAGHTNDTAFVQPKWVKAYASDGSDVDKSYSIDCTGGWYDAGDHGKYVVNGGISVWTLQNMYEMSKASNTDSKWDDGKTMSIPQDSSNSPDILEEARVELEWMFKMIVKSNDPYYGSDKAGMVYHKMHDHKWTGLAVQPWNYAEKWGTIRIVKPPTTAATLNVAATAAQAARLWEGIDDAFAAECLKYAKLTYEAAKANPEVYAPLDQAIGGGAYGDDYVEDDFYWAACELYATTGDDTYYNDLSSYVNENDDTGKDKAFSLTTCLGGGENSGSFSSFNWGCTAGLGTLSLYLNENQLDASDKKSVENAIVSAADEYIAQENEEGMGIPYRGTTFTDAINIGEGDEVDGYEWGSNSFVVNNAMVMAYAYKIKGNNQYLSGVSTALDYIFGRNGLGISYVTGTGDYCTQNPHHRYWSYELDKDYPKAPAGVMSGGAGSGLQDPYVGGLGYVRGKEAPQKCYVDSAEAWSVNEVTINWNAPFAWVLSFMEDEVVTASDEDSDNDNNNGSDNDNTDNNGSEDDSTTVSSLTLSPTRVTLEAGNSTTLKATVSPSDADITWTTSDSDKLTVNANGKITAKAAGTVTVTAKAGNKSATCKVTITEAADDNSGTNSGNNSGNDDDNNSGTNSGNNSGNDDDNNSGTNSGNNSGTNSGSNSGTNNNNSGTNSGNNSGTNNNNSGTNSGSNSGNDDNNNSGTNSGNNSGTNNNNSGTNSGNNSGTNNNNNSGTNSGNNSGTNNNNSGTNSGSDSGANNNNTSGTNNSNNSGNNPSGSTTTNNTTNTTNNTTNNTNGAATVPNYQVGTAADEPAVMIVATDVYVTNTTITTGTVINGSALKYQVTKCDATGKEAMVTGLAVPSVTNVNIPNMIIINNEVYKVTAINAKAFSNKSCIKKVTIGKNIKSIGNKAFYKCKKVKTVTIKTTKLKTKNVKAKAFAKMKAKVTVKVPKSKKAAYKKLLIKRGVSKKAKIK